MTKVDNRRAKITQEHLDEAARLREIWEAKKKALPTQDKFASDNDIGGQTAVWRFLNGRDPLSLRAAKGFAQGLDCKISDFSPRLASEIAGLIPFIGSSQLDLSKLTRQELNLIQLYRGIDPPDRLDLEMAANNLYTKAHPGEVSAADPYAAQPRPHSTAEEKRARRAITQPIGIPARKPNPTVKKTT